MNWTINTISSLYDKVTVILEDFLERLKPIDWETGTRRYTKQKGLLTVNEPLSGDPNLDDESDEANEQK